MAVVSPVALAEQEHHRILLQETGDSGPGSSQVVDSAWERLAR